MYTFQRGSYLYRCLQYYIDAFVGFQEMRQAGVLTDITIEVEGRKFPAHKVILAAESSYFRAMFTGTNIEYVAKVVIERCIECFVCSYSISSEILLM